MRNKLLSGAACAALCLAAFSGTARSATLDDVMARLDKIERENAELRAKVKSLSAARPAAAAVAAPAPVVTGSPKGNPVLHAAVAPSPAPEHAVVSIGGTPIYSKAPGSNAFIDNTTVTLYGHVDLSVDVFDPGVFDQGTKWGVASNLSYFGVRARHNLEPYGFAGWAAIAQYESLVEASAVPTERAAFGSRDSFIGMESPWGTIRAGKADTPYKRSTAKFDPFSATLGDYNSIMGNTGGDLRAEFDWRAPRAVWYETKVWNGFQATVMVAAAQNTARDNSNFALGDFNCPGTSVRGSGSGFPATSPPEGCNDGSYGNLYSASLTYNQGGFTGIGAFELHEGTNRTGDEAVTPLSDGSVLVVPPGAVGIANEWAAKVGAGYRFDDGIGTLQLYGIYERLRREHTVAAFDERSRDGYFLSATQKIGMWDISGSWAHANSSPGSPGVGTFNVVRTALPAGVDPSNPADFALNTLDSSADQYAVGLKYHFSPFVAWYIVGSYLRNGPGAHYCLGVSGHGYGVCGRDANNNVVAGNKTEAVTTGMTFDF
jgi:predicted porin